MPARGLGTAVLFVLLAVAAAGCGGESTGASGGTTFAVQTVEVQTTGTVRHCQGLSKAKQQKQRLQLERDLVKLRAAAATVKGYTENGNAAINEALDRFQLDIAQEALPIHQRSRFIDRAAAIVAPRCYMCFQALESSRPIAGGAKLACG